MGTVFKFEDVQREFPMHTTQENSQSLTSYKTDAFTNSL